MQVQNKLMRNIPRMRKKNYVIIRTHTLIRLERPHANNAHHLLALHSQTLKVYLVIICGCFLQ